jgi:outer membrane protein assembly factor BamE (lipoprotein component of BamABCDE complex)
MAKYQLPIIILFAAILSGCAGVQTKELNTVQKTNQLSPGMSYEEVVQLLGKPKSSQFIGDKWVLRYSLHEPRKGWVPYRLVFDTERKQLASWYFDEEEYQRNQQMRIQTKRTIRRTVRPLGGGPDLGGAGYYGLGGYIPPGAK